MAERRLEFKGAELRLGRVVLGVQDSRTVRVRPLRKRVGKPTKRTSKPQPSFVKHTFEPSTAGEKLGIVRLFACDSTVKAYVSDLLLKQGKLTQAEWRASRRA